MPKSVILASQSPRRQEILKQIGIPFIVRAADVDEKSINSSDPADKVKQLAKLKSAAITLQSDDEIVISADTVVSMNGKIFEKPQNQLEAKRMMEMLSGEVHSVFTGVSIRSLQKEVVFAVETKVEFWPLTEDEIDWYIHKDEPYDKAGGYGIQGLAAVFIKRIIGDYYNVVGLPISYVVRELAKFGVTP